MRLGINLPYVDDAGRPLDARAVGDRARMVEDAGLDGIWLQDSMDPGTWRPDGLMWLLAAAATTSNVELGMAVFLLPIHDPVDSAQRFLTLQALSDDRLTVGVGTSSRPEAHNSMGTDYTTRFSRLYHDVDVIRRLSAGETVGAATLDPWERVTGGPRIALGAWHSEKSLQRAVRDFDGWICSAGRTSLELIREGLVAYRALGGRRAIVATTWVDLDAPTTPLRDDEPFTLRCDPEEAARRLALLAELGFDDVLLMYAGGSKGERRKQTDFTLADLQRIRALLPEDTRRPWDEESRTHE